MKRLLFAQLYTSFQILVCALMLSASTPSKAQHETITNETNYTRTYQECIQEYELLDSLYSTALLTRIGSSDGGNSIYLFTISKDRVFLAKEFDPTKSILFINNAIHPGEPDGVEASISLAKELLNEKSEYHKWIDSVIVCIVPMYNVDGALRRNSTTRANQNGPEEYGFRATSKNLDLNRDFMKGDSRNTLAFSRAFSSIHPTVFLDTHVSNGADYPYTMTLIATQPEKLGVAGKYMETAFLPALYKRMKAAGDEMIPYVDTYGATPETGLVGFMDTPRFASGYAAAHHAMGLISETHMLKPFQQRVQSTHRLMHAILEFMYTHNQEMLKAQRQSQLTTAQASTVPVQFELDTNNVEKIRFKGYQAIYEKSSFGEGQRLRYDKGKIWDKEIPYYNHYKVVTEVTVPRAYIIPQAWSDVIERLRWNNVAMTPLLRDTTLFVEYYVSSPSLPNSKLYEGHYYHPDISLTKEKAEVQFQRGDWYISVDQDAKRFMLEALEPQSTDSYFRWNFFDSVLQQKEWFSDYVFEDIAAKLLGENAELKSAFDLAMATDDNLRKDHWQQLYWVYKRSPYYEGTAYRIPVFRLP